MLAATENAAMGMSLFAVGTLVFACAFEAVPWLNSLLKLVPLPSNFFRQQILVYVYLYTHAHTHIQVYASQQILAHEAESERER
jgi:heme oxygenase